MFGVNLALKSAGLWVGPYLSVEVEVWGELSLINHPRGQEISGGPEFSDCRGSGLPLCGAQVPQDITQKRRKERNEKEKELHSNKQKRMKRQNPGYVLKLNLNKNTLGSSQTHTYEEKKRKRGKKKV